MTFNELHEEYMKMCDEQEDCSECKYDGNFPCQLPFGYDKGRADQKEEDNAFFNFEGAWELEKKKVRADAINNFVINAITEFQKFDTEHGYPTLGDISVILSDVAEQLKEKKMKTYRVTKDFGLEYEHTTVFFNVNSRWKHIGECNGYQRLCRENVFVDVTVGQLREFFKEQQ